MSYRGPNTNHFKLLFQHNGPIGVPPSGFAPPPPPISSASSTSPGDANILERFEAVAKKVEDAIDTYCLPLKPYVPGIGRAFIVATFYEDSLRIISQWAEQVYYLHNYKHRWRWLTVLFLSLNVLLMLVASSLLVVRKLTNVSTSVLVGVVVFQGLFYGLILDPQFLLRNLSVVGGLILAYSDSIVRDIRKLSIAGIPQLQNQDNKKYFLLAGRLLLIALFTGFAFSAKFSFGRLLIIVVGLISCASIVVGYKTKFAAFVLTVLLFTYNMFVNQFWNYSSHDPNRDYLRYEFFQTLSIVGGLLLIVNAGAGELSFDEKKKIY